MTTRRLAAILAADVVGFSSMMEKDEEGTASHVRSMRREVIEPKLSAHHARPVRVYALVGATLPKAEPKSLTLPDKPSIAVLPFTNMSGDPEQEYFADGVVEDIITALSHFKGLFVIARNSTSLYKGRVVDVKQVGKDLGVKVRP